MSTPELSSYIASERLKNTPDATIRSNLLTNGWSEKDVTAAMLIQGAPVKADLVEYRRKLKWTTFFTLVIIDIVIILVSKVLLGVYGLFGIGVASILLRLIVMYGISTFAARDSSVRDNKAKAVVYSLAKVAATIVLVAVVGSGVVFAGCLFLVAGMN